MPTPAEVRVLELLTAIDTRPETLAAQVLALGNPGVTALCEAALGTYPGLREKVRTNAIALLGWIPHPQAAETLVLLVTDPNPDLASRALRASARAGLTEAIQPIDALLRRPGTPPLVAAEAVKALARIDSPEAAAVLATYVEGAVPTTHRTSSVVQQVLSRTFDRRRPEG
jgi:HEAT repeat protein